MKRLIQDDAILAMSNVRGKFVKNPSALPFSFYFSSGVEYPHSIRVKPSFNPEKLKPSMTGILKLSDDWGFIPGPNDGNISESEIAEMKAFFRRYIVLFSAVWDEQMQDGVLADYFRGDITFNEMLTDLDFYEEYRSELDTIDNVEDLEKFCREHNLVNMYGN